MSQPWPVVGGHFFSAAVGMDIFFQRLLGLLVHMAFVIQRWLQPLLWHSLY
ncbi:MAG: hypothetical protein NTW57_08905 [Methylophilales bacterium]|nr:hypothetical protein [Methylophilales bacterium]